MVKAVLFESGRYTVFPDLDGHILLTGDALSLQIDGHVLPN